MAIPAWSSRRSLPASAISEADGWSNQARRIDGRIEVETPGYDHGARAGNPHELEGVLNPEAARALANCPRLVAKGNYSRIGIAHIGFNEVAIQRVWNALASHWSPNPTMKDRKSTRLNSSH